MENIISIANSRDKGILDYVIPDFSQLNSGILRPHIEATHFEFTPVMFQMLQINGQFSGLPSEDPHLHLKSFMEITDSFKIPGVSDDALRLKLFTFSLRDKAKYWFNSLQSGSIVSWNDLVESFLKKYFPPIRQAKSRNDIILFKQMDDEALPDAWERYKELLRKCPHHGIPYCIQLETFYNGLTTIAKQMLDAAARGAFTACTYNDGFDILEKISNNHLYWDDPHTLKQQQTTGTHEADAYSALAAQLTSMANMIKNMNNGPGLQFVAAATYPVVNIVACVLCGENHLFEQCPSNPESVNYFGNHAKGGNYSQNYNEGWMQHPNFSWNSQSLNQHVSNPQGPLGFQNHHPVFQNNQAYLPPDSPTSLETMMKDFITHTQATIRNLETQVGELAREARDRSSRTIPSKTVMLHESEREHVMVVNTIDEENLVEDLPIFLKEQAETDATATNPIVVSLSTQLVGKRDIVVTTPMPKKSDFPLLFPYEVKKESFVQGDVVIGPLCFNLNAAAPAEAKTTTTHSSFCQNLERNGVSHVPDLPYYVLHLQRLKNQKDELPFKESLDVHDEEVTLNMFHAMRFPDHTEERFHICSVKTICPDDEGKEVLRKVWKHKWKEKHPLNQGKEQQKHLLFTSRTGPIFLYFSSIVSIFFYFLLFSFLLGSMSLGSFYIHSFESEW